MKQKKLRTTMVGAYASGLARNFEKYQMSKASDTMVIDGVRITVHFERLGQ